MSLSICPARPARPLYFACHSLELFEDALLLSQAPYGASQRKHQLFIARGKRRVRKYARRRSRVYLDVSDPRYATWDEGVQSIRLTQKSLLVRFLPERGSVPWSVVRVSLLGIHPDRLRTALLQICEGRIPVLEESVRRPG